MESEIYYVQETDKGTFVRRLEITDYNIPQLDRIEKKMDSILELLEGKELSTSDIRASDNNIKEMRIGSTQKGLSINLRKRTQ